METQEQTKVTKKARSPFGVLAAKSRIDLNMNSVSEFAKALGVSQPTLVKAERGEIEPTIPMIIAYGKLLADNGLSVYELNVNYAVPAGFVLTGSLSQSQRQLIFGVIAGTVQEVEQ